MMGIPPSVVMQWTGHNNYETMKPYIAIASSAKAAEMSKFDDLHKYFHNWDYRLPLLAFPCLLVGLKKLPKTKTP